MPDPSTCRGCDQAIRWARTSKGRRIPLDPEPSASGNLLVTTNDELAIEYVRVVPVGSHPTLYTSHFATCAKAANFRGKARA